MKTKFFSVLILLFTGFGVLRAQDFHFGLHATPTISYINTDNDDASTNSDLLFGFGLLAEYEFGERFGLASGVDIINRGGTMALDNYEGEYRAGYVQVPISLKMRSREFGYFTYFAEFGGSLAFRTNESSSFNPDLPQRLQQDNYTRFFNTLFRIGVGMEYSLGGGSAITAGVFYNRSLMDNLCTDDPRISDDNNYRFDYVALKVGFLFL